MRRSTNNELFNMAITVQSTPGDIPVPVSDCLEWCLLPDEADVFDTPGSFATVEVTFPDTVSSIPANGSTFTLWGIEFTVDSAIVPSTANAFRIVSSGNISGAAFRQMLNANSFFLQNTRVEVNPDLFALRSTLITWKACGAQAKFSGDQMDLQTLLDAGCTVVVTNGVSAIGTPGYLIQVRLFRRDNETLVDYPVTLLKGYRPKAACSDIQAECIDFMRDAARLLFTPMPDLTYTSEIPVTENTMSGLFLIEYGWVERDENCQAVSGNFYRTDPVAVFNTVFDVEDKYGMQRYYQDHPLGPPPVAGNAAMFMSSKPLIQRLTPKSYAWLWLMHGFDAMVSGSSLDTIKLVFNVFYTNGTTGQIKVDYDPGRYPQVYNFNVSPGRVFSLFSIVDPTTVSKYFVRVEAWQDSPAQLLANVSTETYFSIDHSCNSDVIDAYFRCSGGGIDTILVERRERDVEQQGVEICLNTPCGISRADSAKYGGRIITQTRAFERVTLVARENYSEDHVNQFRDFKRSTERWIMVKELSPSKFDVTYIAKSLILETGSVKIYRSGEFVELVATGYMADMPSAIAKNLGLVV